MSKNLNFKRKFFILKKDYSNIRGINPKGHGKLDLINNRLRIFINIDNAERDTYYNLVLVGDNRINDLGRVYTDKTYGGKSDFDINYKDMEAMGFPLEKINGILILRDQDILLGGYLDKDDRTIENYIDKLLRQEDPPTPIEPIEVDEEPASDSIASEEPLVDEVATEEEDMGMEEATYPEEEEAEERYIVNDLASPPVSAEEYDRAMQEMFDDSEELSQEEEPPYIDVEAERKENQKNQTTNYVLNILAFFPYIEPFKIDLMGYNWWRIDIDDPKEDKGFLPYFSYIAGGNHKYPLVQNTVTATALMRKHGHYLFGLYNSGDEVKFYVYGVPGDFTKEDHPQKGTTGFNSWFEGREGIGYWLLYIDPTNGRVIYPINPMIPKE